MKIVLPHFLVGVLARWAERGSLARWAALHTIDADGPDGHRHAHGWPRLTVVLGGGYTEVTEHDTFGAAMDRYTDDELEWGRQGIDALPTLNWSARKWQAQVWQGPGSVLLGRAGGDQQVLLGDQAAQTLAIGRQP